MAALERVLVRHEDQISTVTLNAPETMNALDTGLVTELTEVLGDVDRYSGTNAVVLRGTGPAFAIGSDLVSDDSQTTPRVQRAGWHLIHRMLEMEKPVVAMVHGTATGLGLTIVALCDSSVIADDAVIGDTDVAHGVAASSSFVLPLLIGPQRAKELLLTGRQLNGREAAALGIVNRAVSADALETSTYELAHAMASQPVYATRATKLVVNRYVRWITDKLGDVALAYETISRQIDKHEAPQA